MLATARHRPRSLAHRRSPTAPHRGRLLKETGNENSASQAARSGPSRSAGHELGRPVFACRQRVIRRRNASDSLAMRIRISALAALTVSREIRVHQATGCRTRRCAAGERDPRSVQTPISKSPHDGRLSRLQRRPSSPDALRSTSGFRDAPVPSVDL